MSGNDPVRIGLVGLGRFGVGFHLRRLLQRDDVVVAGLCDRRPAAVADACERLQDRRPADAPFYTEAAQLLDAESLDGLIVSTPNTDHAGPCRAAIERDVPVMVDKPTTLTATEAEELVALSQARDVPFLTAFTRRFFPAALFLRERVLDGTVGALPVVGALQLGCPPNNRPQDGGFFHQRNVHIFDLVPWIVGSPVTRVSADVRYDGPWEHVADMRLHLASGTQLRFLSLADTAQNQDEISFYGSRQIYRLQRETLFAPDIRGPWHEVTDLPAPAGDATTHLVDVAAGHVPAGEEAVDHHGADGLQAMRILEAVKEAGRRGEPVYLPDATEMP